MTAEDVADALDVLVEHGYLRVLTGVRTRGNSVKFTGEDRARGAVKFTGEW